MTEYSVDSASSFIADRQLFILKPVLQGAYMSARGAVGLHTIFPPSPKGIEWLEASKAAKSNGIMLQDLV